MTWNILEGDALTNLREMPDGAVQCCVTSPPYWGLRDYGAEGQLGLEPTPEEYVERMVEVFREVRRVLRDDGTLWLNLGDSYGPDKQLMGMPWRVAFALQADGWYLRSDIIWAKPNPMPESVTDRPTKSHEYLFLMSKSARYFYDAEAIREISVHAGETITLGAKSLSKGQSTGANVRPSGNALRDSIVVTPHRNKRTIWTVPTRPFPGAHFAVMPPDLVLPCVQAGSAIGDLVLDPFSGAGTVGVVATRQKRSYVGIELNPEYAEMSRRRIEGDAPLFNREEA